MVSQLFRFVENDWPKLTLGVQGKLNHPRTSLPTTIMDQFQFQFMDLGQQQREREV
jgi:hypothetical protein